MKYKMWTKAPKVILRLLNKIFKKFEKQINLSEKRMTLQTLFLPKNDRKKVM